MKTQGPQSQGDYLDCITYGLTKFQYYARQEDDLDQKDQDQLSTIIENQKWQSVSTSKMHPDMLLLNHDWFFNQRYKKWIMSYSQWNIESAHISKPP